VFYVSGQPLVAGYLPALRPVILSGGAASSEKLIKMRNKYKF